MNAATDRVITSVPRPPQEPLAHSAAFEPVPPVPADGDEGEDSGDAAADDADPYVASSTGAMRPVPEAIRRHFELGGRLSPEDAEAIIGGVTELLRREPNVLSLDDPVSVCGDIHGQFYDLLTIFDTLGGPPGKTQYLFLGDYVDRGNFSTEVTLLLYAYKLRYPTRVWLLRGNHECRHLTTYFNFRDECLHKYDEDIYELFLKSFDCLPLAAVVAGQFLCVHGGLSPSLRTIEDIKLLDRFREPPQRGAMCDLLWSDPMEDDEEQLCKHALFLHNDMRGCSFVFSHTATVQFLADNGLSSVIRGHEAQDEGFRMYRKVEATGMPSTMCVFSAPNYCNFDNRAAILQISGKQLHVRQFHSVEQPYCLPNFMNTFSWSMPFVVDKILNAAEVTLDDGVDVGADDERLVLTSPALQTPLPSSPVKSKSPTYIRTAS